MQRFWHFVWPLLFVKRERVKNWFCDSWNAKLLFVNSWWDPYGGPQLTRHGKTKNLTAETETSRQNQKPHGKNKISHGKTKTLTAKTKYLTAKPKPSRQNKIPHSKTKNLMAKPNTSQQKQNSFGFAVSICFCREVFDFCCEVFGFAVRSLVLPWGFWFCREVFCFCREVFGFAVTVVGHRRPPPCPPLLDA